jgi:hypothetical protein
MVKLIYGVGINDGKYPATVKGKIVNEYNLWKNLLGRCYSPKVQKKHPTYIGCSVSENFKNYSYFYEWCQNQTGFDQGDFHLDKDFLIKGNKLYSEDTCLFLPRGLNNLLLSSKAVRGDLPVGVSARKNKFQARCCTDKPSRNMGLFNTPELAFQAYKQAKEDFIKLQAEKWKALIDPRAFAALMAYTVSITD